ARRCRHAAAAVALALVALAGAHGSALAEKRVALVIGNDLYEHVSALRKAVTDANAVASNLRELGFTVVVGANQTRGTMSQALLAFDSAIEPGDTAFFFFAGHGFEIRGQNYLLPTDIPEVRRPNHRPTAGARRPHCGARARRLPQQSVRAAGRARAQGQRRA